MFPFECFQGAFGILDRPLVVAVGREEGAVICLDTAFGPPPPTPFVRLHRHAVGSDAVLEGHLLLLVNNAAERHMQMDVLLDGRNVFDTE